VKTYVVFLQQYEEKCQQYEERIHQCKEKIEEVNEENEQLRQSHKQAMNMVREIEMKLNFSQGMVDIVLHLFYLSCNLTVFLETFN